MDQERVKYERMHRIPGYSPGPGIAHVHRFVTLLNGANRIVDFGCGTGDAALELHRLGREVYLVDIASNCLRDNVREILGDRFFATALHELPEELPVCDWGFCSDVMEHLPPEWVEPSLAAMRRKAGQIYFSISGVPDGWGRYIGEVLHLTVRPLEWWLGEIGKHFGAVEPVGGSSKYFEIVARS